MLLDTIHADVRIQRCCQTRRCPVKLSTGVRNKRRSRPQSLTLKVRTSSVCQSLSRCTHAQQRRKAFLERMAKIPVAYQPESERLDFPFMFPHIIPTAPVVAHVDVPAQSVLAPCPSNTELLACQQRFPLPPSYRPAAVHVQPVFSAPTAISDIAKTVPRCILKSTRVIVKRPLYVRKDARPLANAVPYRMSWKSRRPAHYTPLERSGPLAIPHDLGQRLAAKFCGWRGEMASVYGYQKDASSPAAEATCGQVR